MRCGARQSLMQVLDTPKAETLQFPARWSVRLVLLCFTAISVSLPMAWISLGKLALLVSGLFFLLAQLASPANQSEPRSGSLAATPPGNCWFDLWAVKAVLVVCAAFASSLLWSPIALNEALTIWVKHAKLLEIALLVCLIRNRFEARAAMFAFAIGQALLMLTSWLLVLGVPVPWGDQFQGRYAVFSSYLDQSIMFSASAAIFWHLRAYPAASPWVGAGLTVAALANVLIFLEGRTGYLVALAMIGLMTYWALPRKWRWIGVLVVPCALVLGLWAGSTNFQARVLKMLPEGQAYATASAKDSSTGWRLNAWHRSVQAVSQSPWYGHGVGSWTPTVKKLEGEGAIQTFGPGNASNPHQEYLLWAVELGVGGGLLLLALMVSIARDANRFATPIKHSTWSVLAALSIACMFNSALYDGLIGDFFVVALGLLLALGLHAEGTAADRAFQKGAA